MATGQERLLLPAPTGTVFTDPRWPPDGARIGFVRRVYPRTLSSPDEGPDVVTVAPDGSGERIVARWPRPGAAVGGLSWAGDGQALYVSAVTLRAEDPRYPRGSPRIERSGLEGGRRRDSRADADRPAVADDGAAVLRGGVRVDERLPSVLDLPLASSEDATTKRSCLIQRFPVELVLASSEVATTK